MTSLHSLTEEQILQAFTPIFHRGHHTLMGPGDDCAIVKAPDQRYVITTDVLVGESHFSRAWSRPYEIGERAAAQNLADVWSMGARATCLTIGMTLPEDLDTEWMREFARGIDARAHEAGAGVEGGDMTRAIDDLVISVTALGDLEGRAPLLRSGACPGDVVAVAGTLGYSHAGLMMYLGKKLQITSRPSLLNDKGEADCVNAGISPDDVADRVGECAAIYRAPRPPLHAGITAAKAGCHAMMDVSDGLVKDSRRMATASGVVIDLHRDELASFVAPLESVEPIMGIGAWECVFSGGEDHGLLGTFAPHDVPEEFRVIGHVTEAGEYPAGTVVVDGKEYHGSGGWDHFAS